MVKFSSVHGEEDPWVRITGWGRGVEVRSEEDLNAFRRLIAEPGADRRAVIFNWMPRSQRRSMVERIHAMGIELRLFDASDKKLAQVETSTTGKLQIVGVLLLTLPVRVAMRLSGRKSELFEATTARQV
ncbi:MAG TPA: hypothetical protein VFV63_17025 [Ilumatobacteraceae bacterium]|nr:hypothetical protein [Ilumatobacteraceae bacterium]